jgi:hypothetical protein
MSLSLARSARKLRRTILAVNGAVSLPNTPPGSRWGSYTTVARQPLPAGSAMQAVWISIGPATERWGDPPARLVHGHLIQELTLPHGLHDRPSAATHPHGGGRIQPLRLGHRRHPHRVIGPDRQELEHLLGWTVNDDALFDPHDRFLLDQATTASAR